MSTTPLRDAWNAYKDNLDTLNLIVNVDRLEVNDYALVQTSVGARAGRVVKMGRTKITLEMPYGDYEPESDFRSMSELEFKKDEVVKFYKPKKA